MAQGRDNKDLPADADQVMTENRIFSVPNTIYWLRGRWATLFEPLFDRLPLAGGILYDYLGMLVGRDSGFQIAYRSPASYDDITHALRDKNTWGIWYVGHGPEMSFAPKGAPEPELEDGEYYLNASTALSSLDHGLGLLVHTGSFSAVPHPEHRGDRLWRDLVSVNGVFAGHSRKIVAPFALILHRLPQTVEKGTYEPVGEH